MPKSFLLCWTVLLATPLFAPAQSPAADTAAPAKTEKADRPAREKAVRELLQKLPKEKRQQVLSALRQVWADADVKAARQQLREAADAYKRTMRDAIQETDPEIRSIVGPVLERLAREGLAPNALAGGKKAGEGPVRFLRTLGLTAEKMEHLTPEERHRVAAQRDRVMNDPRVKEAAATLEKADTPAARAPALRHLRQTARATALEADPQLAPLLDRTAEPMP